MEFSLINQQNVTPVFVISLKFFAKRKYSALSQVDNLENLLNPSTDYSTRWTSSYNWQWNNSSWFITFIWIITKWNSQSSICLYSSRSTFDKIISTEWITFYFRKTLFSISTCERRISSTNIRTRTLSYECFDSTTTLFWSKSTSVLSQSTNCTNRWSSTGIQIQ